MGTARKMSQLYFWPAERAIEACMGLYGAVEASKGLNRAVALHRHVHTHTLYIRHYDK